VHREFARNFFGCISGITYVYDRRVSQTTCSGSRYYKGVSSTCASLTDRQDRGMGRKKESKRIQYLKRLYETPSRPGSFQGPHKLLKTIRREKKFKFKTKDIEDWLKKEESYGVHKKPIRRFPRIPVIVEGLQDQYDADLMILRDLAGANNGYKYVLIVIDVFSRYVWAAPMILKNQEHSLKAFKAIFSGGCPVPKRLRTDKGGEFTGKDIDAYFRKLNIQHFLTWNEIKANYAEKAIQTIKKKMFRYMTFARTRNYVDVLPEIIRSYNRTYHTSIGMSPSDVSEENEMVLWWDLYGRVNTRNTPKYKKFKYKVGDTVRLSRKRTRMEREYDERWTNEIFRVCRRFYNKGIIQYKVEDYSGVEKKGSFYEAELQGVTVDPNALWRVDAVLKERGKGVDREVLVHWHGWPKKYDEWIPAGHLV